MDNKTENLEATSDSWIVLTAELLVSLSRSEWEKSGWNENPSPQPEPPTDLNASTTLNYNNPSLNTHKEVAKEECLKRKRSESSTIRHAIPHPTKRRRPIPKWVRDEQDKENNEPCLGSLLCEDEPYLFS
ncbi:hypothetical protein TWF102_006970 [Orbilia oligospora]|uniref:Uncharacterized protein n=1 Tax=Orbilia oligospora TaxID=2813651 RepID=A0A7C8NJG4_ORBOL|nr:hypothetical protein TWF103_005843 [Orbilia oligospora]KAF3111297.1 hypothetical protein TWF102_006970 [Orbilia oligospora]